MRLLLDTHVVIWAITTPRKLSCEAQRYMERAEAIYVSAVSIFEIAVKESSRKLDVKIDEMLDGVAAANAIELPITWAHARRAYDIGHPDPFDRLLIAQAEIEPLYLLTVDDKLAGFSRMVVTV